MSALALDLVALALERKAVDLDHVVEHAREDPDDLAELLPVEPGRLGERLLDESGQVHRTQQARTIWRQRLLTAIVRHDAIGIERIDAWDLAVIDRRYAGIADRRDLTHISGFALRRRGLFERIFE